MWHIRNIISSKRMYVTRPRSFYRCAPGAAAEPPPPGPGSGYLVTHDDDDDYESSPCCVLPNISRESYLKHLPFPQDGLLKILDKDDDEGVEQSFFFIPVIDTPLSANWYYVVHADGRNQGKVSTCSTESSMGTNCFGGKYITDEKPSAFDHRNAYQQVEIRPHIDGFNFYAKSIVTDGFPSAILRRKGWRIRSTNRRTCPVLVEAFGVDESLRAQLPSTNFAGAFSSTAIIGRWHCPFMFVREELPPKEQAKRSTYYEMTLRHYWELIYQCENDDDHMGNMVRTIVAVEKESPMLYYDGRDVVGTGVEGVVDGIKWFEPIGVERVGLGLSEVIVERMRWEQERGGWVDGDGVVEIMEEFNGDHYANTANGWKRFRCFVLVERFALKRMDGTLIFTYDFRHANKVACRWE